MGKSSKRQRVRKRVLADLPETLGDGKSPSLPPEYDCYLEYKGCPGMFVLYMKDDNFELFSEYHEDIFTKCYKSVIEAYHGANPQSNILAYWVSNGAVFPEEKLVMDKLCNVIFRNALARIRKEWQKYPSLQDAYHFWLKGKTGKDVIPWPLNDSDLDPSDEGEA